MAPQRRPFGAWTAPIVSLILAQTHTAMGFAASDAVQPPASSILDDTNRTVPEYITRYAPLVWLHSDDPFRPADILEHIRHTTPMVDQKPLPDLPDLDLDNLAILDDVKVGDKQVVALTSNDDDVTNLPSWLFGESPDDKGKISNATPCVVVAVERSPRDVDAFYFYFYSYDRGANISQVLPPLNSLAGGMADGMHYGDHVGDWEHNMVRFRDGKPVGIYYSQHSSGAAYQWDSMDLTLKDGRPLVFSAYGSHANYASSGDHVHDKALLDWCDAGQIWDPVLSAYVYHMDPDTFTLTPLFAPESTARDSNLTSFFYYRGLWGDTQYANDDPRQKTVPVFGLKRFVTGPQGPIWKDLVRKTLFPDNPEPKQWVQWIVGIFMSWYPCCLRGWRFFVSLTVFIAVIVLVVIAIRRGIRWLWRLRAKKGYSKLDAQIPLEEYNLRDGSVTDESDDDVDGARRDRDSAV